MTYILGKTESANTKQEEIIRMADMIEQQAQELKDVLRQALNLIEGEWPEGDEVAQPVVDKIKKIVGERHDI